MLSFVSSSSSSSCCSLLLLRKLYLIVGCFLIHQQKAVVTACTDILVTPKASSNGTAMIAYNADDVSLFGYLYHYPATTGKVGEMIQIHEWDTGKYLGEIPQVNETYNVVGNGNEYGLVIGETTFGGVTELSKQPGGIIDYGSLIYLTLQRCKTAREAIQTMNDLMDTYGYASSGESFSIADRTGDVWLMEVIGRGDTYGKLGSVWVAYKIPNGYISAHANQARITTFPRNKPNECLYANDVVDVAIHYGLYSKDKDPLEFSFSDIYDPVKFSSARFCEARVWSIFSSLADNDKSFQLKYQEYASGKDLTNRMPLFIKPYKQLSIFDIMDVMNSHYEGTELDASNDVGSGLFGSPRRPRPLTWEYQGNTYHNERHVATFRTGWNFIAEIRLNMPVELSTILWFAVDDSSTSPRFPIYTSTKEIPLPYAGKGTQDGIPGPILQFDITKAFWVQNMVSNFCYWQWNNAYPIVRKKIDTIHNMFYKQLIDTDQHATNLYYNTSKSSSIEYITQHSVMTGTKLHNLWFEFYGELFVQFRDFYHIIPNEGETRCGCTAYEPGLSDVVKRRIVMETGSHYEVSSMNGEIIQHDNNNSFRGGGGCGSDGSDCDYDNTGTFREATSTATTTTPGCTNLKDLQTNIY